VGKRYGEEGRKIHKYQSLVKVTFSLVLRHQAMKPCGRVEV
jgi:hypothetical protein